MKKHYIDKWLVASFFLLIVLGIIMVYSSSAFYARQYWGDHLFFLKRHLKFLIVGLIGMTVMYSLPYRKLQGYTWYILMGALAILFYAAFIERGRWISWGFINFQAVDVAKFALILFFADSLSRKERYLNSYNEGLFPHLFYIAMFAILVLMQPDFSSAFMLISICLTMLFVAPIKISHLFLTGLSFVPMMIIAVLISPYKMQRMLSFLAPGDDIKGSGYQVYQSLVSLGTGGVNGVGFAHSTQKMFFLPEAHTDFIFAIIGEELGLLGTVGVISLFLIIMARGIKAATRTQNRFDFYLIVGLTAHFVLYAVVNMMVTMQLLPATGLPLPFISYGGTALLFSCIYAGLLMRITNDTLGKKKAKPYNLRKNRPAKARVKKVAKSGTRK